jgi:transposase
MMGRHEHGQGCLFYQFDLEEMVPADHLLRGIDHFLDLQDLRDHLVPFYSHTGRPSVDPELMIRTLIVGYAYGIRSERRLCEEVKLNLAYRWFCKLSIEDAVPDHSTFSKNRHGRFRDSGAFRHLFEAVVCRAMQAGLVGGEGFAVDASQVLADASRGRRVDAAEAPDWSDPKLSTRPVREYLDALDEERTPPKQISLTDPAARWTAGAGTPAVFAYSANYLVDLEAGIVMDAEATPAIKTDEVRAAQDMIERVEADHAITPERLAADTAYGSGPNLSWLVEEKGIEPHIPVWDRTGGKDETFGWSDFEWDEEGDCYHCPAGHILTTKGRMTVDDTIIYRASKFDCDACPLKQRCCPNTPARKIARSIHEDARDYARMIAQTEAYVRSRNDRKKVEMVFAHMKRILGLRRFRLRGLSGASDELTLAATVHNLRKLAKLIWRPPMTGRLCQP